MKRDMELVRLLLIQHETDVTPTELEKYSDREVLYSYKLMQDAGLIAAGFVEGEDDVPESVAWVRLTWSGHDFLDATRDSKIWKLAKEHVLKPGVSWTFQTLLAFLRHEIDRRIHGADSPTP